MVKEKIPEKKSHLNDILQNVGERFSDIAPRSKEHLAVYCALVLNTQLPSPAFCPNHVSPLDALWLAYSEEDYFSIWHAMRGSGKTHDLAVLSWLESVFKPKCGTTILGGSLEQSTKAIMYLNMLWDYDTVPRHLLIGGVHGRGYKLTNGSWVQALAASPKSVRGPHPQKLRLDEVDEMEERIFNAALGQPKGNFGIRDQIVVSSTVHNPFGMMSKIIDTREERDATWLRWCVEELRAPRGFWTDDEIARKRKISTEPVWESEYLLLRPSIGDTVYDYELVEDAYERGKYLKHDNKVPTEAGIDWGHSVTIMNIVQDFKEKYTVPESYKWELVELTERCQQISDICIEKDIKILYTDISPKDSNITLRKILTKNRVPTKIMPVAFNKFKTTGIKVIQYMLKQGIIDITDKELKKKMQEYHYKNIEQEQIAKEDDHYPDALTAWAASRSKLLY